MMCTRCFCVLHIAFKYVVRIDVPDVPTKDEEGTRVGFLHNMYHVVHHSRNSYSWRTVHSAYYCGSSDLWLQSLVWTVVMSEAADMAGAIRRLASLRSEVRALSGAIEVQRRQRSDLQAAAQELRTDMASISASMSARRRRLMALRSTQEQMDSLAGALAEDAHDTIEQLRRLRRPPPSLAMDALPGPRYSSALSLNMRERSQPLAYAGARGRVAAEEREVQLEAARERMRRRGVLGDIAVHSVRQRAVGGHHGNSSAGHWSGAGMFQELVNLQAQEEKAVPPGDPILDEKVLAVAMPDVCGICLESRECDQRVATLPCNHSFHVGCAQRWLARAEACPTCRCLVPRKVNDQSSSQEGMLGGPPR
jgi:hypothetical protein